MANVVLLKSQMGAPVFVQAIPSIKYGPFTLCLSTYNESHVPLMAKAAKDFELYIVDCYRKQGRPRDRIITNKLVK